MKELEYPFDAQFLLRKRKMLKRVLLQSAETRAEKHIAILGGSTTHDIKEMMELFLLNYGIQPAFYESEYAQYWQDAMFENEKLELFKPDVIFIHTSNRNITSWPGITSSKEQTETLIQREFEHYRVMWERLHEKYHCIIIQNNMEFPFFRLQGNRDATDARGRTHFVNRLNSMFADYAADHENFYINDIQYQSADFGLSKWSDPESWYMYKYSLCIEAIPSLAFQVSNIIKSVYGKNKKAIALDLDNTLWGGVVGDDGPENLEIGQETALGQGFTEFQIYLKNLQQQGVLLTVLSKNEKENAESGLRHPQMQLREEDFASIKANWEPKSQNLLEMSKEISLLPEAFVFADDNPAERAIVEQQVPGVAIPQMDRVENYIRAIDKAGYFETTVLSKDDLSRSEMYAENRKRQEQRNQFSDYSDYLKSLNMTADIRPFEELYYSRIAQLTNKSNQFNLTTLRCSQEDIRQMASDPEYITLYGRLRDCFGDNGIVSLAIGKVTDDELDIILWLMSCRVLKRDMECAMMDEVLRIAHEKKIQRVRGHYYPTQKNKMVREFYNEMGFEKCSEDESGNTEWIYIIPENLQIRNHFISVNGEKL